MPNIRYETLELGYGMGAELTNAYLVMNRDSGELLVFDPAGEPMKIHRKIEEMGGKPVAILLTHGHFDHFMALEDIRRAYDVPVYCGEGEKALLEFSMEALPAFVGDFTPFSVDVWVRPGEALDLAGLAFKALGAPGHSTGGLCYYFEAEKLLIAGDTLFRESIGRTDFPFEQAQGDLGVLMQSIKTLLTTLPDDTKILPGHGPATTVAHEKRHNPFVRHYLKL